MIKYTINGWQCAKKCGEINVKWAGELSLFLQDGGLSLEEKDVSIKEPHRSDRFFSLLDSWRKLSSKRRGT